MPDCAHHIRNLFVVHAHTSSNINIFCVTAWVAFNSAYENGIIPRANLQSVTWIFSGVVGTVAKTHLQFVVDPLHMYVKLFEAPLALYLRSFGSLSQAECCRLGALTMLTAVPALLLRHCSPRATTTTHQLTGTVQFTTLDKRIRSWSSVSVSQNISYSTYIVSNLRAVARRSRDF